MRNDGLVFQKGISYSLVSAETSAKDAAITGRKNKAAHAAATTERAANIMSANES